MLNYVKNALLYFDTVGAAFCHPHNDRTQMTRGGQITGGRMPPLQNWYPVWQKPFHNHANFAILRRISFLSA